MIRADKAVAARLPGLGRKQIAELIAAGAVRVNGRRVKKGELVPPDAVIEVEAPPELAPAPEPDLPLIMLHEDAALLAFDKPAGLPSHPLERGERGTLAGAIVARYPECVAAGADPREAGLVHRLDAGTSGVLVAARSRAAWEAVRESFRAGRVRKEYLAVVAGEVLAEVEIDDPIAHDRARGGVRVGERMGALDAYTLVVPLGPPVDGRTRVRCEARTGRMHQIRAHLAARGWPIVGDTRYGGPPDPAAPGHRLHASKVELPHPVSGERLVIVSPAPWG